MNTLTDEDEQKLQRLAFMERLKGPSPFAPSSPPPSEVAQATERERLEALKRPIVRPTLPKPDFITQERERLLREQRHERLKAAIGGRIT